MESYELNIISPPRRYHNYFPKGHIPFNKGVPMNKWMDGRKKRKVLKYLELGRIKGNGRLAGANRKAIVGIKDGKLYPFESAVHAAKILKVKGYRVNSRNICRSIHNPQWKAGGFRWFFADEIEKYKDLIVNNFIC
jgi:hypothetical protein